MIRDYVPQLAFALLVGCGTEPLDQDVSEDTTGTEDTTTTEGPSYNITVIDHRSDAGGDDGIALFNVRSGLIANAYVRDSFARGINLQRCGDGVRLQNNTLVRSPLLLCPNPPC